MQFLNPALAFGLLAVAIPIIIHILTRQTGRTVDWGAMHFLKDSLVIRNRRIRLEEALLMASRCLLLALIAAALARPFIPPGVNVPWFFVLPLFFIAAVCFGIAIVLWEVKLWRWILLATAIVATITVIVLIRYESVFNLSRFKSGGRQDIALIIDASTSMALETGGVSNFDRARREAETIVKRSPRGNTFSLILGGPTPSARVLIPTTDRQTILEHLAAMEATGPLEGGMAAYDCLTLAALGLAQGNYPAKQVIVITDGQSVGWETNKPTRWNFLKEAFAVLPSTPQVIVRQLDLPTSFRNLSIADISYSRKIIGVDRPVKIRVTIENTGTEAVSPEMVELTVGGQKMTDSTLGQLLPGTKETIEFSHLFEDGGAQEIHAKVLVTDDIVQDDEASSAINVAKELRVLLVDGNPGGRFFDRAASFAGLALAPSPLANDPAVATTDEAAMRFLVAPEVLPAIDLATMAEFNQYDAVILADVPRLPRGAAQALEGFMQEGGGVLVTVGQRASEEYYNTWIGADGQQLLPAKLVEAVVPDSEANPVSPSLDTFRHPAVRLISNRLESDFETGTFDHYWKLEEAGDAVVGGRLSNGDAYLVSRKVGLGNLVMLGSSLDLRAGNLPSRQSFVPFIHEMVYFLANPSSYDLNLDPKWELALHLSGDEHAFAGHGLKGHYYKSRTDSKHSVERIDPSIQFNWRGGAPAEGIGGDNFKVEWSGKIQPPRSGNYKFECEVDDYLTVYIDGVEALRGQSGRPSRVRTVWLDANRLHHIRVEYHEDNGNALATLFWESEHIPKQVVPPQAFRPFSDSEDDIIAKYRVTGPNGEPRMANITATPGGAVAKIKGDVAAGVYRIHIPEDERAKFGELLGESGVTIPFTVRRDPAESRLQPLTQQDKEFMGEFVAFVQPTTAEEVIHILSGQSFGEELWKFLAVGALMFLLIEVALSRWIASSRRAAEDQSIQFETEDTAGAAFRSQLAKVEAGR
ncbi:MAG: hypothetical protein ACI8UO_005049 [Verrucomicrobiales bacterium]|jgi:hypothetical protein